MKRYIRSSVTSSKEVNAAFHSDDVVDECYRIYELHETDDGYEELDCIEVQDDKYSAIEFAKSYSTQNKCPTHVVQVLTTDSGDTDTEVIWESFGRINNHDNTIMRDIQSSTSDDEYSEFSFMVGDQLEWSGLYGGEYKGVVTNVTDEYITVDVMWTAEDTGDTIIDTQRFEIATDPEGRECIIVYRYRDTAGYVYPPSNSRSSKDATFKTDKRLSPTSERYNRKHSVTSSETFDAQSYAKQRKQSSEFNKWLKRVESAIRRNDTTRIKNIKESLMYMTSSQLSNKLTSYLIDKLNSALTTSSDDIKSSSYGGAFDIEDDQYSAWRELASKSVEDSDGFYTDYTLYTDGQTYICMFGDKDLYEPDASYADYETESESDAWDWFNSYTGFADEEDEYDDILYDDILESTEVINSGYSPDLLNDLVNYYRSFDNMSSEEIWDEIVAEYNNEDLANDVLESLDHEEDADFADEDGEYDVYSSSNIKASMGRYDEYFGQTAAATYGDLIADRLKGRAVSKRRDTANEPGGLIYEANKLGIDMWDLLEALEGMCNEGRAREIDDSTYKILGASDLADEEDLPQADQEYDSAKTSINSNKLPAIYHMITLPEGSVGIDYGGGKFDNAVEALAEQGVTLYVYDPYNRSQQHNRAAIKALRANGGADFAINSNVLNVIKEPEARLNVLENIKKITKPGAPIYITVYEGSGKGNEGVTKSGYQLNRKTADYLEEIQQVFPDAKRRGKLIVATNSGSVSSSTNIKASATEGYVYTYCDECGKKNRVKVTFNSFNEPFNDTEYKCKYCGTRNLLTDPHSYDENGNVVEASQSYLDRIEELMEQGLDEDTASREAYAEFYPDEYDADDYDEIYSANYGGTYYVDDKYIDSSTDITAASKLWMGKYKSAKDNKMHKVYFEFDTSDFEEAEQEFEDIIPEPYSYARLLGTAPHEALLQKDGFEKIQSSSSVSSRYWYFTRHGVQPGSVPKYVNILDIVDTPEGSYFLADGVISTNDLRNYEIKERKPENDVVEASKSPNSAANRYTEYMKVSRGGQDFSVHYDLIDNSPSADPHQMWLEFQASVSAIKPYDDAEYAWAQIENGHINVIKGGKVIQQYYYFDADDMDVENSEWCDAIIEQAIDYISKINDKVESRIVHNSISTKGETVEAGYYDIPEPPIDPPEDDSWTEVDGWIEDVDLDVDAIIEVLDDGSWIYEDETYPWAVSKDSHDGDHYSYEYYVHIGDPGTIVEDFDDVIEKYIPSEEGRYRLKCNAVLKYFIEGVEVKRSYYYDERHGQDYDEEVYKDNANVELDEYDSKVENVSVERIW